MCYISAVCKYCGETCLGPGHCGCSNRTVGGVCPACKLRLCSNYNGLFIFNKVKQQTKLKKKKFG